MIMGSTSNRDAAIEFVRRFCSGDAGGLGPLLAGEFHLKGPLFEFTSKQDYLDSMAQDGLEQAGYEILSVAESADTVSIFYEYQKAAGTITIAQRFQFSGGLITDILLVFDTR